MKRTNLILLLGAIAILAFGFIYANNNQRGNVVGTEVGNLAPDLKFNNPDGKPLDLADLKGNIVLVDFWASWCHPCRMENPNVVKAYNKYKDAKFKDAKGFKIFSVSLDQNVASWKKAIQADHLTWKTQVSDLKGWQSKAAALYGVNSIPMNFLLDKDGVIIAEDLRGNKLEEELSKLVKK